MTPLRLGTRGSRLAHAQAALAAAVVREAGLGPVAIVPISTAGDRDRRSAFSELGARGVFSKELEDALLEGRIDVAVHSAKDLTTDETPGLTLAAVLPRADARDAWCGPHASLAAVPHGARVGTASMRRGAQLRSLRPDLSVESLRGNVDTRLRKRTERGLDGVVLAACGLDRLELQSEIGFRVEVEEMLPETGQGFLAIQTRSEDAASLAAVGDAGARARAAGRALVRRAARRRLPRSRGHARRAAGRRRAVAARLARAPGRLAGGRGGRARHRSGGAGRRGRGRCPRSRGRGDRRGGARVTVYLVGAGPGDPGLITARGQELLRRADVVVYDRLAGDALLDLAPAGCLLIDAGKQPGRRRADPGRDDAEADRARPPRRRRRAPEGRRSAALRPRRGGGARAARGGRAATRSSPASRRRSRCRPTRACR